MKHGIRYKMRRVVLAALGLLLFVLFLAGTHWMAKSEANSANIVYMPLVMEGCEQSAPGDVFHQLYQWKLRYSLLDKDIEVESPEVMCHVVPGRFGLGHDDYGYYIYLALANDTESSEGSDNIRNEFRQRLPDGSEDYAFSSATDRHEMEMRFRLTQVPFVDGRESNVVVCQIHDANDDVSQCRIRIADGVRQIFVSHGPDGGKINAPLVPYAVGDLASVNVVVANNVITHTAINHTREVSGSYVFTITQNSTLYYEAGLYPQCADAGCAAQMHIYGLDLYYP